ncbi:MAG: pimeloyl-ACP methyl ester esterase BioH [Aquimonas sp.]|nr:pimeloyl-ACP methyl ester esterase BioH [Aquimonas sp.]
MHVETLGHGSPLVLIHGWAMHGGVFGPLIERLSAHHQLHLVDLPGHGLSREREDFDLGHAAQRIAAQTPPAPWLGWSLGGLIALQGAVAAPAQVRGLICIASSPRFVRGSDWPHAVSGEIFEQFAEELGRDYRGTLERFLSLEALGSEQGREVLKALRACVFERGEPAPDALLQGLDMLARLDLRQALATLPQRSLWIAGRRDRLVPPAAMRAAAALNPRADFLCIEGAGHAGFLSHTAAVADAVLAAAKKMS